MRLKGLNLGIAIAIVFSFLTYSGCTTFHKEKNEEGFLPATSGVPAYFMNDPPLIFIPVKDAEFQRRLSKKEEWNKLNSKEQKILDEILRHWETWMPAQKADGSAPLLQFEPLYEGLNTEQKNFLDRIRAIEPRAVTIPSADSFKRIEQQKILKQGKEEILGPQYLPADVFPAYEKMMDAMRQDLGKRLFIDSGYRSPAYQLYTFLFFMPKHHYSIKETRQWVALPGHSEHGNPASQAIDFINEEGENGEDHAENFERLPEYDWLQKNASRFDFELSYPRGTQGTAFEPWHWRHVRK